MNMPQVISDIEEKVKDALEVWAEWMRSMGSEELGYGSPMGFESPSTISSWEDFERKTDKNMAINVQAIYEGLPQMQQLAIDHFHLSAVWKPNRGRIEDYYADALVAMQVGLRRRGLV